MRISYVATYKYYATLEVTCEMLSAREKKSKKSKAKQRRECEVWRCKE